MKVLTLNYRQTVVTQMFSHTHRITMNATATEAT